MTLSSRDYAGELGDDIFALARHKNTFPIDTRVEYMLSILGLPNNEDMMIQLCEKEGINARILDRMLYTKWENCPEESPGSDKECDKCGINLYCWMYILR